MNFEGVSLKKWELINLFLTGPLECVVRAQLRLSQGEEGAAASN